MDHIRLLARMLGGRTGEVLLSRADDITELRLRTNRPAQITLRNRMHVEGETIDACMLKTIVNTLMENSLYAWENELKQGYFTAAGGLRVGVCGRFNAERGNVESLSGIASLCIRIPREVRGCADALLEHTLRDGLDSLLILSPPGLGKTTVLREYVRKMSEAGFNVSVADERREIAACVEGIPQLNVGRRTDVLDGCPKALAIPMLIRSAAPDLIAVDEIGSEEDAQALMDARRCGVAVAATAHASGLQDACRRRALKPLIKEGVFRCCVVLGPGVGEIKSLQDCGNVRVDDAEDHFAIHNTAVLHRGGKDAVQYAQAAVGSSG